MAVSLSTETSLYDVPSRLATAAFGSGRLPGSRVLVDRDPEFGCTLDPVYRGLTYTRGLFRCDTSWSPIKSSYKNLIETLLKPYYN